MARGENGLLFTLESVRKIAKSKVIHADDFDVSTVDGVVALDSSDLGRTNSSVRRIGDH